jgi:hypothetical protein
VKLIDGERTRRPVWELLSEWQTCVFCDRRTRHGEIVSLIDGSIHEVPHCPRCWSGLDGKEPLRVVHGGRAAQLKETDHDDTTEGAARDVRRRTRRPA